MEEYQKIKPSLISEAAERVFDPSFRELPKSVYEQALFRANRIIAKKYSVMQAVKTVEDTPAAEEDLVLNIKLEVPSFRGEYLVVVNGVEYRKVPDNEIEPDSYTYHMYEDQEGLKFNYSPRKVAEKNEIQIYYTVIPDLSSYETTEPVIPTRYREEQIEYMVQDLCRMAIPRVTGHAKDKYIELLKLYSKQENDIDPRLTQNNSWTEIKLWQFP